MKWVTKMTSRFILVQSRILSCLPTSRFSSTKIESRYIKTREINSLTWDGIKEWEVVTYKTLKEWPVESVPNGPGQNSQEVGHNKRIVTKLKWLDNSVTH
jgi:hypothetical protein